MRPGMASKLVRIAAIAMIAMIVPRPLRAGDGLPNARLGTPTAPLLLLSRADVRADLRLDAEQSAEAARFIADLHDRALALRGRLDAEAKAARGEVDAASLRWLSEHLADPQRTRLAQLDLQWEGPSALVSRPIVAETLRLSIDQRTALKRAVDSRNSRRNGGPPIPGDEARLTETALGLLNPEQREHWHAMLGAPLSFQAASRPPSPAAPARR